tara:strand:+ start:999 stop:1571 length:573 start_codon:yes stop_codon:yes gene_type:complete
MKSIKVTVVGDSGVGKTSILNNFVHNDFKHTVDSTIGAAYYSKKINYNNEDFTFQLWDTAGQERYRSLIPMYYRDSHFILCVYDLNNPLSFETIKSYWVHEIRECANLDPIIFTVGNKYDKPTNVDTDMIDDYCNQFDLHNIKVSAKTNQNIKSLFETIIQKALEFEKYKINKVNNLNIQVKSKNRKCCY